ncbi:RYamide receptor-like [Tubulanus polymorphus]|uniref:RYamide receptor-like n=1 Tax=Tubulanus polymorphus TaxID=672921 RepID=UPI003DA531A7
MTGNYRNYTVCQTNGSDTGCSVNSTAGPITDHSWSTWALTLITAMYVLVIVCAVIGNGSVCYIVLAFRRMRTVTNYFIVNLAISDLLMAVLCIPFTFTANVVYQYWPFGHVICSFIPYLQIVAIFLSSFTLVAIALDRYIAISYPMRPKLTGKQAFGIIALIWVISTGVSLPVALTSKLEEGHYNDNQVDYCDEAWKYPEQKYGYSIAIMVLQYFLPLSLFIFAYVRICVIIWVKKPPGEADDDRDRRMTASKRKIVKMMMTIVIIYALCWLPVHTVTLAGDANPNLYHQSGMNVVWVLANWLSMSNSCYNPIVYWWMNKKFRAGFRHVYRCLPCCRATQSDKDTIYSGYNPPSTATYVTSIRVTNSVRDPLASRSRVLRPTYNDEAGKSGLVATHDVTVQMKNIPAPVNSRENVNGYRRAPSPAVSED